MMHVMHQSVRIYFSPNVQYNGLLSCRAVFERVTKAMTGRTIWDRAPAASTDVAKQFASARAGLEKDVEEAIEEIEEQV